MTVDHAIQRVRHLAGHVEHKYLVRMRRAAQDPDAP